MPAVPHLSIISACSHHALKDMAQGHAAGRLPL